MTSEFADQPDGFFGKLGPGSRVAGYLIEEQIGAGGMAVVFRARDEVLGRLAAVKVIAPSLANDEEFRARFLRESRTIAAVDSLHIIPVYAAGEAEGLLYIATRFVPGGDLAMLMRRSGGRLAADRTASLIAQVASALDAAHAAGLVHRDVKPQNILVDTVPERPEHAFLSDFGLSKGTQSSTALTVSGQFLGTPDYSAPEQIRSEHVDGRADQYALACVAFVLLTGELPFHRPETVATMFAHVNDPVPLVTRLRPELPPAVNDVIVRALAKSAAGRYGRCGEFAAALREALVQARPAAVPDPYAWLARRDGAARIPSGHRARQPPARFAPPTSSPPARSPAPQPAARPQPAVRSLPAAGPQPPQNADWVHPSLPPTFAAEWEKAIQANAAYANTTTSGKRRPGRRRVPLAGGPRRRLQRRNFQTALIGGAAAVVIGAAGAVYAAGLHGSSAGAVSVGSSAAQRPGKPALAATLTVPGGGTVDTVWISPDGKRIAASGKGSKIYIWNRASPAHPVTLTAPNMRVGKSSYSPVIDNVAFSANDASLTVAEYPQAPPSANEQSYAVYRWDLAAGKRTAVWSISTPSTVSFSGDNNEAVDSQHGGVRTVALSSAAAAGPRIALPGGTGLSPSTPYNVDLNGTRMMYHPVGATTYIWDFVKKKVIAKLRSNGYEVFSPDGRTVLIFYPPANGASIFPPPILWNVATQSNVTPTDPRWQQQQNSSSQADSWVTFSTDGSVIETKRAGGITDLWNAATRKHLLTITDPNYREDSNYAVVGPGGSEVVIFGSKANGKSYEYRQLRLWETPLG